MAITQKGNYYYGDNVADLKKLMGEYSQENNAPITAFAQSVCICGGKKFVLSTNENRGVAKRCCTTCNEAHYMCVGKKNLQIPQAIADASMHLEENLCLCNKKALFLLSGIATLPIQENKTDKNTWYYVGAMCPSCRLIGVYADWTLTLDNPNAFLQGV